MSTLSQTRPAVKAPVTAAEWAAHAAAHAAARTARQMSPPVFVAGDRILYRTPRRFSRNIRGVVVKVNAKTVTIRYALINRMTQEVVGYETKAVDSQRLIKVVEPEVVEVVADEMPWEVLLDEVEAKPGLWFDEPSEFDELEFMAATLDALRLGLTEPVQRLTAAQMREIEDERVGADFCERPYAY